MLGRRRGELRLVLDLRLCLGESLGLGEGLDARGVGGREGFVEAEEALGS